MQTMKKTFYLQGLTCANCAHKIEKEMNLLQGVSSAYLDLVTGTLQVLIDDIDLNLESVRSLIQSIEPDVLVFDQEIQNDVQYRIPKSVLWGIAIYGLGFIWAMLLKSHDNQWIVYFHYVSAYILLGFKVVRKAFLNFRKGKLFDENFLMTIATFGAILLGEFAEAVAVMLFYRIGDYYQGLALSRSRKSIQSLLDLKPTIAHLYKNQIIQDVLPETLKKGMQIIVKNGETIPVDGIVLKGESHLDVRMLTGETIPIVVRENDQAMSGAINNGQSLMIEVTEVYAQSTVMKMITFLQQNGNKKAKTEQFMTRFAKLYTPVVVLIGLAIAFLIPLFLMFLGIESYLNALIIYGRRALIFLVISCPCALVLSIPLSFFAGIGVASRRGILIKSGLDLEMLNQIEHVVFDKTGTLTKGEFAVHKIVSEKENLLLEIAAHVEYQSTHPIARAIVSAYLKPMYLDHVHESKESLGHGVEALYKGKKAYVGKRTFLEKQHIFVPFEDQRNQMRIHVAYDNSYLGYIVLADQIRDSAHTIVKTLEMLNIDISMVTGDQEKAALEVAETLNIKNVYANTLPFGKVDVIKKLKEKQKVAFIGDGMNDALVLSQAHLGIAMGSIGSDLALDAADIVMMNDDLNKLKTGLDISIKTKRIVMQNIYLSIGVKVAFLTLGALGIANIWMAVFADVGILLVTIFNALRIFKI
jgi:Zn2+/Cd2+-exporting ATPase